MRSHTKTFPVHPIAGCLARLGQRRGFLPLLAGILPGLALAELPSGGVVVGGAASATINYPTTNQMVVNQVVDRSIINWQSFSVGSGNYVQFIQPSSSAVVLNRVVGGSPSEILGSMSANGQVFLVNPNGVFFGAGASIDVAGLVATTLDIRDQDFLAGNFVFTRDAASPATASVTNAGTLKARNGGYVVLAGDYAANTGVIQAKLGTVALAAGSKLTLDLQGDRLINFAVNEKTLAGLAGVANAGQLLADGGRVVMTAAVAGDLSATVVNNTGLVQAQSMVEHGGEIYLAADGGSIRMSGTLDASAQPGANGGHVSIVATGGDTTIADGALIKVSGNDIAVSNAGTAYLWADGTTRFEKGAKIEARGGAQGGDGGFIEVSGNKVAYRGQVDARAPHGKIGTLLIDPNVINIASGSGSDVTGGATDTIYEANLESALGSANVHLVATGADATITLQTQDGILDGRNGGSGGGLTLGITNATGTPTINLGDNSIAVDGALKIGNFGAGGVPGTGTKPTIVADAADIELTGGSVTINAPFTVGSASASNAAALTITATNGDVNLSDAITVQGRGGSSSDTGAKLEVYANNGNINHTAGHIQVINTGSSASAGGAKACFVAGGGSCSGSGSTGSAHTVSLGKVTVTAGSGWARVGVNATGGITLNDNVTAQGRYKADVGIYTWNSSAGISLANAAKTIKADMTGASSGSGGEVEIQANNNGTINLAGAVVAYGGGSNGAQVNINGGTVTVAAVTASNSDPSNVGHRGNVQITSQSGDITLNGPITVTANSNSGSGAYLSVQSAQNINHGAGAGKAISVRNHLGGNGGAYAEFRANGSGTATVGQVSVRGFEGAELNIYARGGISVVDNLTATADGGHAQVNLGLGSGSPASIPITLAAGKFIRAIATAAPSGSATIDINGNGGGPGDTINIQGTIEALGGAGASSGQASIQVSGGNVTLGTVTATAGNSAQISVQGTNITLNGNLEAADSIQLSPNYNGATGNITGNGHNMITNKLVVYGGAGGGTFDLTTNAANIEIYGGNSVTVNAAGQTGTLSARLGCSSGSGAWTCGGPGAAIGDVAITAGGTLDITQFYTTGTTHFLRADTLTISNPIFMPVASSVTLAPYTVTNVVGVHSATDTDATIQTNYSGALLNLFSAGSTVTIGGTVAGLTGDIHVGADGVVDLGDRNLVLSTAGAIVVHDLPTTTGTITQISGGAAAGDDDVQETITNLVSGLGSTSGGDAGGGDAGNSINGLLDIGAPPGGPPPVFQLQGDGLNLFASGPNNGPGTPDDGLKRR